MQSVCAFYTSPTGCRYGAACRNFHPGSHEAAVNSPGGAARPPPSPSATVCVFFQSPQGCRFGPTCRNRHELLDPAVAAARQSQTPEKSQVCQYFQSPQGCLYGANCRNLHPGMETKGLVLPDTPPVFTDHLTGPFFALDVECVANGRGCADRVPARLAVCNSEMMPVFDSFIKPECPVVSYLTPLTGIVAADLENAKPLSQVLVELKRVLPADAILIGQGITSDLDWLGFRAAADYATHFDVAELFRVQKAPHLVVPGGRTHTDFSLRHIVKALMKEDMPSGAHDAMSDAQYAMRVFQQFRHLHRDPAKLAEVQRTLLTFPHVPSFAEHMPFIDGVALSPNSHAFETRLAAAAHRG